MSNEPSRTARSTSHLTRERDAVTCPSIPVRTSKPRLPAVRVASADANDTVAGRNICARHYAEARKHF
jgi:hypothetical protein